MAILNDFKENVFKVLERYMTLDEFEQWLYKSDALFDLIGEDVILEAFSFNYKQTDAIHRFKKAIFSYFNEDEFLLWKVKSNLHDLMTTSDKRDRILYDFYNLGYDGYYFLQPIGYYRYEIEDTEYYQGDLEAVLTNLRQDAEDLLLDIERQELDVRGFRLTDYRHGNGTRNESPAITRTWWDFWK